jgi:hypothetical protein
MALAHRSLAPGRFMLTPTRLLHVASTLPLGSQLQLLDGEPHELLRCEPGTGASNSQSPGMETARENRNRTGRARPRVALSRWRNRWLRERQLGKGHPRRSTGGPSM